MTRGAAPFRPGWALTAQAAAAVAIVLALAAWQVSRALEKTALRDARIERLRAPPVSALDATAVPDFTRVSLTGAYDAMRHFLVAGRRGRGFDVLTPLATADGVFLAHRGWLAAAGAPDATPDVPTPAGPVTVIGVAWPASPRTRFVAQADWPGGWPKRVPGMDPARMAAAVDAHPREFRLERGGAGVFHAAALTWDDAPGMHWGYAAQWVLIGAAVAGGYVLVGKRRSRKQVAAEDPAALEHPE